MCKKGKGKHNLTFRTLSIELHVACEKRSQGGHSAPRSCPDQAQIRWQDIDENKIDGHNCAASVTQLAFMLGCRCTMISQDNKAKVPVRLPAVSRSFAMVQGTFETISAPNHDFPDGPNHKLIPSFWSKTAFYDIM
jgi:hypothetical protein